MGEDGYEYEYYDDDETPALAPVTTPAPSSILKKPESAYGAGSSYGSYGASSYGGSSYGAGASSSETPSRNTSAYGASSSSYGASRTEPEQAPGRSQRSYGGAKTTSAYGGSWGQETEQQAAPMSPGSSRRYSRYTSPEPTSSRLSERRFSREDSSDSGTGYSGRFKRRDDSDSFVSRYLAKSRTSATIAAESQKSPTPEETVSASRRISGELQYPSGRSRYAALKERKAKLAKSKSSATIGLGGGNNDEDEEDDADSLLTPFTSRFGSELARSRSSHLLKDQNSPSSSSPSRQDVSSEQDENLRSWATYLKNKYGGRGAASGATSTSRERDRETEKEERRSRLGLAPSARADYEPPKKRAALPRSYTSAALGGLSRRFR
jgi:hypothetical protein